MQIFFIQNDKFFIKYLIIIYQKRIKKFAATFVTMSNSIESECNFIKNDRLLAIRDKCCGGNNRKFADSLDVSETNISTMISGKRTIGLTIIELIAEKYPDVNLNWLITGKGPMLISEMQPATTQSNLQELLDLKAATTRLNQMVDSLMLNVKLLKEKYGEE